MFPPNSLFSEPQYDGWCNNVCILAQPSSMSRLMLHFGMYYTSWCFGWNQHTSLVHLICVTIKLHPSRWWMTFAITPMTSLPSKRRKKRNLCTYPTLFPTRQIKTPHLNSRFLACTPGGCGFIDPSQPMLSNSPPAACSHLSRKADMVKSGLYLIRRETANRVKLFLSLSLLLLNQHFH